MYALEMLLVSWGILAFRRALSRRRSARLAQFGVIVALLLYTQYWALYLLLVVGALAGRARVARRPVPRRGAPHAARDGGRRASRSLPWLPTFLYQRAHTGTPWGTPQFPGVPFGYTLRDFAGGDEQEGWLLLAPAARRCSSSACSGARPTSAASRSTCTRSPARGGRRSCGSATLVVGLTLTYLAGGAFESRYSAVVFPFFVLLVARGCHDARRIRVCARGVLAVMVVLGFVGAVRNVATNRTEAGQVAAVLRADARPGDLVVYCPDQLGPAVHRLAPPGSRRGDVPRVRGRRPSSTGSTTRPGSARVDPQAFARSVLARAGAHTLWFVTSPGYIDASAARARRCRPSSPRPRPHRIRVGPDQRIFEHPGLQEFPSPRVDERPG